MTPKTHTATKVTAWTLPGFNEQPLYGNTHVPTGTPSGVIILAHGFKGYKDYGMFPLIADHLARHGFIAHRFNFSHSGMTNEIETFARPELFEIDTWNKQVFDLNRVIAAVTGGELAGANLPLTLFGHSRGGVTTLLALGRTSDLPIASVITAAAPSSCQRLSDDEIALFREQGYIDSPSGRTGQNLRIDRIWIDEQLDEPEQHDLPALIANITCPIDIIHGTDDTTVPPNNADELATAIGDNATVTKIDGANHVFNTPNPPNADGTISDELRGLLEAVRRHLALGTRHQV